ncbi:MAG: hypothetical protein ABI321_03820 [Polyangia bacterium]
MDEIYELVRALRAAVLPRNRNFDTYASAAGKRARRIHRFLLSVEKDLARAEGVSAKEGVGGALELTLLLPALGLRRVVQLDSHARALLLESEQGRERLAAVVPQLLPHVA